MKRLFIILLILCPLLIQGKMYAQIYMTASKSYHSFSSSGMVSSPAAYEFQSTSRYAASSSKSYATAPISVANGSIRTIASTVTGGVLTNDNNSGYIPPESGNNQGAVIAGVPDTPIGEGWDVALFLATLCVGYTVYQKRKSEKQIS